MTNGLLRQFIGLYRSILMDATDFHPTLRKEFDRDLSRLESLSTNMGVKLFTLALPTLGKVLDQALDSGRLAFNGEPLSGPINRKIRIPRLFRGFWMLLFDADGCLKQDIDPNDVLFLRTLLYAGKRYQMDCSLTAKYSTIKEFYDVDEALPPSSQIWDGDGSSVDPHSPVTFQDFGSSTGDLFRSESDRELDFLLRTAQECADRVSGLLGEFIPSVSRFRHGPGAVSDLDARKDFKYSFRHWNPRLQWVFPASEFAVANSRDIGITNSFDNGTSILMEWPSVLCCVLKTQKAPRLFAKEPSCNQWCQQSVRSYLTDAISACVIGDSIDFGRQELSGELALAGSIDGSLATIDLSSASDRLSCAVVERMFRKNDSLLSAMIASRTRYIVNRLDVKQPKLHKLRKFASMGSALTFPVQSIVFYTLCCAAGLVATGTSLRDWTVIARQVRVYGDDLIVPVSWMPFVEKLFTGLLLKINRSKTFTGKNFRESCGSDCFRGYYVTPGQVRQFYDESKLSTLQGVVDTSNNLFYKGFWHASSYVLSTVQEGIRKLIPSVRVVSDALTGRPIIPGSVTFGLTSPSGTKLHSRKRWNYDLQREECAVISFESKRSRTTRHEGSANLLQYFTEDPSATDLSSWASGLVVDPLPVARKGWVATGK